MLIEVKAKVTRNIDDKTRKKTETYVLDSEFFSEAEYDVITFLNEQQMSELIESFEIFSLRVSTIKEIDEQTLNTDHPSFIATLEDIFLADDGTEKPIKYKVLLWAENLTQANQRAHELSHQGYDMHIEGIKQVDYVYLNNVNNGESEQPSV